MHLSKCLTFEVHIMDAGGFLYSKAEIQTMALEDNTKHLNYSILQKSKRI